MGKSTLLRQRYPDARRIDLLKSDELRRYATRPELLRQEIEAEGADTARQIVIDEVQKAPALLDEVHWLMENRGLHFALCGSSARKVRRGAANLLGGRALRYEMSGLTAGELESDFDLDRMLNHGYLPRMYESSRPRRLLDSYVADYLREDDCGRRAGAQPPCVLGLSGRRRAERRRDGELCEHRAGVRRVESYG